MCTIGNGQAEAQTSRAQALWLPDELEPWPEAEALLATAFAALLAKVPGTPASITIIVLDGRRLVGPASALLLKIHGQGNLASESVVHRVAATCPGGVDQLLHGLERRNRAVQLGVPLICKCWLAMWSGFYLGFDLRRN